MPASTEQKVDFLLKKIGYTASKSGIAEDSSLSGTKKAPFAEAIPSPLATPSSNIWADSTLIPATPPGSDTAYVKGYRTATALRMTADSSVSGSRAFIAYTTYNNTSTPILGDWIDTQFGADYIVKVYKGDPNSSGVQLSAAGAGSNDTWFFDYASGVLNFNGTQIPSGVTDTNIYIVAYRYIGAKGARPAAGIATFKDLYVTGLSTFVGVGTFNSHLYVGGNLEVKGTTAFNGGTITLGDAANDNVVFGADVDSNIIPDDDDTYDLGSTGQQWRNLYLDGLADLDFVNVSAASTFGGLVDINAGVQANTVKVEDLTDNRVIIAGTGGELEDDANLTFNGAKLAVGVELDVDGQTTLDHVNVSGVSTFSDTVQIVDNKKLSLGTGNDFQLWFIDSGPIGAYIDNNQGHLYIRNNVNDVDGGDIYLQARKDEQGLIVKNDGEVDLYYNNVLKLSTASSGINVVGTTTSTQLAITGVSTFTGDIDANGHVDIDGHTELDNVNVSGVITAAQFTGPIISPSDDITARNLSISGVSTFAGNIDINSPLVDIDGHLEVDNVHVAGVTTFTGAIDANSSIDVAGNSTFKGEVFFDNSNNAARDIKWNSALDSLNFYDNTKAAFGDGLDLTIYHNATDSFIKNSTNKLKVLSNKFRFNNVADNKTLIFADDGGAVQLYFDGSKKFSTTGIGVSIHNGVGNTATIAGPSNLIIDPGVVGDDTGSVRIKGDLYVDGSQFVVASGTIELEDHVVGIATTAGTNALLDGGGIGIGSANIRKTLLWNNASAALKSSENFDLLTGKVYKINGASVLSTTTLGPTVVDSSLKNLGTLIDFDVAGISTFNGNIDANANLDVDGQTDLDVLNVSEVATFSSTVDVDGQTELDHLNVAGVSTFAGIARFNGDIDANGHVDIDGHTELDNVNVSGVSTFAGNLDINASIDVSGNTVLNGDVDLGNATSDTITATGRFDSDIVPSTDNARDLGASGLEFKDLYIDGTANIDALLADTAKIGDLTDNRVVIAGSSGELEDDANLTFNGVKLAVGVELDVDGQTTLDHVNVAGVSTFAGDIDANGHVDIDGHLEVDNVRVTGVSTLTTLRIGNTNNIDVILDEDNMASDDVNALATQQSIKAYVDSQVTAQDLDITDGTTAIAIDLDSETLSLLGTADEVTSVASGNSVTLGLPNNVVVSSGLTATNLSVTGVSTLTTLRIGNTNNITSILDEDNMASNSATSLATQQSIKAYVDSNVTAQDLDFVGDSGSGQVDLDSQTFQVNGTPYEIVTTGAGQVLNIGLPDDVIIGAGLTVTSKFMVGGQATVGITTILDEDNFISNSATALATQQSIKAYVDSGASPASNLAVSADSGSNESINLATEVLDIEGTSNEIETVTGTNKVIIGLPNNVTVTGGFTALNANITGVSTFVTVDINGNLDVDGGSELDNVNVAGLATVAQLKMGSITATSILDEDNMASNSAAALATQQSIKAYVDSQVTAQDLDFQADTGGALSIDLDSEVLGIVGTTNEIETAGSGNNVTIGLPNNVVVSSGLTATNLSVTGVSTLTTLRIGNTNNITHIRDEDNMASDSATSLATQQSIKAYVDSQVTAQDLDFQGDTGGALSIDLDSEVLSIIGTTNEIETAGSGNNLTIGLPNNVVVSSGLTATNLSITGISTLTNLRIGNANNIDVIRDEDNMASDDPNALATQQSIKAYVDSQVTAQDLDVTSDSGTIAIDLDSETLDIAGTANEIETSASGNEVTIGLPNNVAVTGGFTALNANITGVSTFAGTVDANGMLDVDGHTELDNVNVSGIVTTTNLNVGVGGTTITTQNTTSRVGINSTAPAYMLDVGGIINSSTDVKINGVSVVTQETALNDAVAMAIALG